MKRNDDAFPSHPGRPYPRPAPPQKPQKPLQDASGGAPGSLLIGGGIPQSIKGLDVAPGLGIDTSQEGILRVYPRIIAGDNVSVEVVGGDIRVSATGGSGVDTGWINCGMYGPYRYERRTRIRLGTIWQAWSGWSLAGTKNHAWVERSPGPPQVRQIGEKFYLRGFIQRNTDTSLPTPSNTTDYQEEYRWLDTPDAERYLCYRPPEIASWTTQQETSGFLPSAQNAAATSGIAIYYTPIAFTSTVGPAAHSNNTWVRLSHAWVR